MSSSQNISTEFDQCFQCRQIFLGWNYVLEFSVCSSKYFPRKHFFLNKAVSFKVFQVKTLSKIICYFPKSLLCLNFWKYLQGSRNPDFSKYFVSFSQRIHSSTTKSFVFRVFESQALECLKSCKLTFPITPLRYLIAVFI